MQHFLFSLWAIILDMAPYLLLGFFIAGVLHAFVPQTLIARHMARPGWRSVLNATLLGVPLPLCSCGVLPTTVGLRRSGVSRGACTAFLISTPQTGVDSILATYSVLGLPFAVIRPVAALVTGLCGGIATDVAFRKEQDDNTTASDATPTTDKERPKGLLGKLRAALAYAFMELLADVGKWLVIGLLIAAVITVTVPEGFFDVLRDYPLVNMLIVLAIAIPMYVCATGSIPIAYSLMVAGLTPGAALVLLMAGPAINSASMLVIGKVFGRKQMTVYLSAIVLGAILFGLGIDYLLPPAWFSVTGTAEACCHAAEQASWFSIACGAVFMVLLAVALWRNRHHHHAQDAEASTMVEIKVSGMRCSHCAQNVRQALLAVPGVASADVDHTTGLARLTLHPNASIDKSLLSQAIEKTGFEVQRE